MFNPREYANSLPDGFGVLEVVGEEREPRRFVPLRWTELTGEVIGPVGALCLTQVFGYTKGECDRALEALYRFPLPGDAAVTGVTVRFGQTEIRAALKEREEAERDYAEATAEGRQAALTTRESPDVFTLQVAGLKPDEEVVVRTEYVQLARPEGGGWSLRVPLTTAPRYVRDDEAFSRPAQGQPLALLRDPGHRFSLDLTVRGAARMQSPTHALEVTPRGDDLRVRLRDGKILPDRDCLLVWTPRQERDTAALQVWTHDDGTFVSFLALVAPPAAPGKRVPREVVLLVDHSGSMTGAKWEAADWAVKRFLAGMTPEEWFALSLFHDATRWLAPEPRPADPAAVREAVAFLEANRDSGGTELAIALEEALRLPRGPGEARHVLIITDAQVSDAGRLLRLAEEERRRPDRRRISLLCIDAAPNATLVHELAERGGGAARFLTSAPDEGDIATALDAVLAEWDAPALAGLRLEVSHPEARAAGAERLPDAAAGWSALDLGDLPAGRAAWVAGRVPSAGARELAFRLVAPGAGKVAARSLPATGGAARAIGALAAARLLLGLERLAHARCTAAEVREALERMGYDPDTVLSGAPEETEGRRKVPQAMALRRLLARESLAAGVVSSETAFVATREEAGERVAGPVVVASALPAGWSEEFLDVGRIPPAMGAHGFVARMLAAPPPGAASLMSAAFGPADVFIGEEALPMSAPTAPAAKATPGFRRPLASGEELFSGVPRTGEGEILLWGSEAGEERWPGAVRFTRLLLRFPEGAPEAEALDPELALLLFVADMAAPRARVTVADLLRQGGERPLNLRRLPGEPVRLLLQDPSGAWQSGAPRIEVALIAAS